MLRDLLLSHPPAENLHILPTTRAESGLALSSRNAYLESAQLDVAPTLYRALCAGKSVHAACTSDGSSLTGEDVVSAATRVVMDVQKEMVSTSFPVEMTLDYVELFDPSTFEPVRGPIRGRGRMVLAGAIWVGKTRLIDNLLLGWDVDEIAV